MSDKYSLFTDGPYMFHHRSESDDVGNASDAAEYERLSGRSHQATSPPLADFSHD